jgi:hypothetical protein
VTKSNEAWLSAALHSGREDARPRQDCPPADRIWRAVQRELPLAERLEIIDHLGECPACAESWQLAAELAGGQTTAAIAHPRFSAIVNRSMYLPIAATLLLALAGIVYMTRAPVSPIEREPLAGVLETRVAEGAVLPRDDFRLQWEAGPAGARYDVVLTTAGLEIVAEARGLETTAYRVPAERLEAVAAGTQLLFRVVAHAPDGTTLSSRTTAVSVR